MYTERKLYFALGLHQELLTVLGNDTFEKFESIQSICVTVTFIVTLGLNADSCQKIYMLKYVLIY